MTHTFVLQRLHNIFVFRKNNSVKLSKTLYCQIFELVLFSFSQVALFWYYLEKVFSVKQVNSATIS